MQKSSFSENRLTQAKFIFFAFDETYKQIAFLTELQGPKRIITNERTRVDQ